MDLKTGVLCSLPVVLLICTVCSEAFALRKPENEELVSALARLDRALGEMISRTDGSIPYKRNEGSSMKRFPIDGPVPYKRFYEGAVPYKREDGPMPYKRGWWLGKPSKDRDPDDELDDANPYKRQDYGDDIDIPYKRRASGKGWWSSKPSQHRDPDKDIPYKRNTSVKEPRNESLDRVLRYLLDMEERLHERNAEKRDHDDQ